MGNKIVELKERVYEYVYRNGPILPNPVAKHFQGTTLFISALLSELVTNKKIRMTRAKIGSSPLYYCKHQEDQLYAKLREHVGLKPKEALDTLYEKRVLRDRDCLPFERVALRELPDFAKPLRLVVKDTEELFWRWHMLGDEEAKQRIELILEDIYGEKKKPIIEEVQEVVIEEPKIEVKEEVIEIPAPTVETKETTVTVLETPKVKKKVVKKKPKKQEEEQVAQTTLQEKKEKFTDDDFYTLVKNHLQEKGIIVHSSEIVKKNREFNFLVSIPSSAGDLRYFVKARNRKKLNEGDVLLAFTESQNKKLPLLYLSNAELTKKAQAYIAKNLPGMSYIRL